MTTVDKALLVAANVHVIANREDAGKCLADARWMVAAIEKCVNRPVPPLDLGPCPTVSENQTPCGADLQAKREEIEVTCHRCRITYNVKEVIDHALESAKNWLYTERELLALMAQLGEPIPRGTWWTWRSNGLIESRNELGAEPKYWLEDARRLREERVGKRERRAI
jgi:hypothetical protein